LLELTRYGSWISFWNLEYRIWNRPAGGVCTVKAKNTPEILAPIDALEEVEPLMEAGADWLYGGVLPPGWAERYPSTVLINQRTFASAQFSSLKELEAAIGRISALGGRFALTLNAPFYMDEQYPLVLDLARRIADAGASAFICADPGLMIRLKEERIDISLHLSTMGLGINPSAVRLFADMGVSRVILPRFLTTDQIRLLIEETPEADYEAFILVGRCPNIEGLCTFDHDSPDRRWPCEWSWKIKAVYGGTVPDQVREHFAGIKAADRRDGCGLCALPVLRSAGVTAFKIVGRGASLPRKVGLVRQTEKLLRKASEMEAREYFTTCLAVYRDLFGHPCADCNCYYPEVRAVK
jgi:putative protease